MNFIFGKEGALVIDVDMIQRQIDLTFAEINYLIRLMYATEDEHTKNLTLNQMWNKIAHLQFLNQLLVAASFPQEQVAIPIPNSPQTTLPDSTNTPVDNNQREFTREQLAQFTGMNGQPAYVAVNGVVYDVTNNAAWSVATHFGLSAGRDLTQEFASCHTGQQWILDTLVPVGRLIA
ncbi:cytochrome b5 domain-containing protein [Thalassobacillus devorans]|uniref:cytochrome b5 domain-containing protein n=1 Tax=Thalassobacillus devorans TaxID=279813 RepID=UPI0004BC9E5D|nr:cytochrome b5 domain-containing protein [Thalassobacillus devorans]